MKIARQFKKDSHLHSEAHVLADELSVKFNDKKHFGFYLKMALTHDHDLLRRIAGEVLESKVAKKPGALFAYLLKKSNPISTPDLIRGRDPS
jgi:formamidopyrimidine-DNA glycosylase